MGIDIGPAVTEAVRTLIPDLQQAVAAAATAAVERAMSDRLCTVEEAAGLIGCTPTALRKRIARGDVPVVRAGHTVRLRRSDLITSK